jgi:hypothetical protein
MSFRWGKFHEFTCEGHTAVDADADEARGQVAQRLRPSVEARQSERREAHERLVAAFETEQSDWEARQSALADEYLIDSVEEQAGRFGRKTITRQRVTMPGGGTQTFDDGLSASDYVKKAVEKAAGDPPSAPPAFDDLSDDELLDQLLQGGVAEMVWRWKGAIEPNDDTFDSEPFAGPVRPRLLSELNRLGAGGWQIANVSEDRTISAGDSGTSTTVSHSRYTLMREVP